MFLMHKYGYAVPIIIFYSTTDFSIKIEPLLCWGLYKHLRRHALGRKSWKIMAILLTGLQCS